MPSSAPVVLDIQNVSKRYVLNQTEPLKMQAVLTRPHQILRQLRGASFWAVREVSMQIREGEVVGIIGHNGSGKSTLLYMMLGISPPTEGAVVARGRVAGL